MKKRAISAAQRGFTLLELVVAIAVVGVVSVVVYGLFDTTSQNFLEVDQLSSLNDRVRFANELVRGHLSAAGSQSTPDSTTDDLVAPPLPSGARVAGIYPYAGWQDVDADDTAILPADVRAANPNVGFDGIVVAGAYDYPLSFEFAGMDATAGARVGRIYLNYKGVGKLIRQDPFTNTSATPTITPASVARNWSTRLVRISDRQGYQQFIQPLGPGAVQTDGAGRDYLAVTLPADGGTFAPKFKGGTGNGFFGLDDLPEGDTGYDAGLIDFYWIHVVPDEASPNVMTLVRDRLCGATVAAAGASLNPSAALATTCAGGVAERVVLASYIADFQVWFDCADTTDGAVRNAVWSNTWIPPRHNTPGDCMNPAAANPGLARVGHIRIAMHTESERVSQQHIQFEDSLGAICPPAGTCDTTRMASATLRTYDFVPTSAGAARVVVMQSDFELVNFVNRNPL